MTPEELESIRKNANLSPTEMAKAMGVDYNSYRNFVVGRHKLSRVTAQLAHVLDAAFTAVSMDDFRAKLSLINVNVNKSTYGIYYVPENERPGDAIWLCDVDASDLGGALEEGERQFHKRIPIVDRSEYLIHATRIDS